MSRIAILGYHKVGPPAPDGWDTWFYVPEQAFAEQLATLGDSGWQPVDCATFLHGLTEPTVLPERAALITFDDGYRSVRELALPLLQHFGYPAVLFMPTDFVGGTNVFDLESEPEERLCDWDDLRELLRAGVAVQSHGASHRAFSELTPDEREHELERSKTLLEAELGQPVELFAYPYGDDGGIVPEALIRAGYSAAFGYGGSPVSTPPAEPYRLERLAMGPDTELGAALES